MRVESTTWDDPDVKRLATAQQVELRARYDGAGEPGTPPSAADISAVVVARSDDGTAVGCGALRELDDGTAELKRMYVAPAHRGAGVATAILAALEDVARNRGWWTLRLETGPRQPEAAALYSRAGYRPVDAFGHYRDAADAADSLFFERVLEPVGIRPAAG